MLTFRERPAAGAPEGLLVLHHGRGADEHDLLGLGDVLDPERRLHVGDAARAAAAPGLARPPLVRRAARRLPRPGDVPRRLRRARGVPRRAVGAHRASRPERTVLGGFSMGSVMSYSLGLGADRPAPAGILAFSGFVPVVEGWAPDLAGREHVRAFIAHGRRDPVMEVGFARRASELLTAAGLDVEYHESDAAHHIDPAHVPAAVDWLRATLA